LDKNQNPCLLHRCHSMCLGDSGHRGSCFGPSFLASASGPARERGRVSGSSVSFGMNLHVERK